jgi:exosortase A-associated hydrolase 1
MSRRHVMFECEGSALLGTLDEAESTIGLLLVTGGNEIRSGAWGGQAKFAARIGAAGFPVFRFDRRGVGDSEGANAGFRGSGSDMAAALAAFRAERPGLSRVVGMGNCDAASALMLSGGAGLDALLLCNPWTIEDDSAPPPPAAVRDHYRRRLTDPAAIRRLLTGGVSLRKLAAGLFKAAAPAAPPSGLASAMADGISGFTGPVCFLLAGRDRTAQAFLSYWNSGDARLRQCPNATHSFVEPESQDWLVDQALGMLQAV